MATEFSLCLAEMLYLCSLLRMRLVLPVAATMALISASLGYAWSR